MSAPAYKSHSTATVSNGNSSVSVDAPTPAPADGDYQLVGLLMASSSVNVGSTPSGWTLLENIIVQSDNGASGTSRVALYEISSSATLSEQQASFAMTLTGARVWAAIRGCYTLPTGSTGRTVAVGVRNEAEGTGGTSHDVPDATTTEPDSLAVVFGGSDQHNSVGEQNWTSTGTFTQREDLQGGNSIERQAVTLADLVFASAGAISGTFTTLTADEVGMFSVILDGVSDGTTAAASEAPLSVAAQNATVTTEAPDAFPATASISVAAQEPAVVTSGAPGGLYDLSLWKITLPTDGPDGNTTADEITQPALETYEDDNFFLDGSGRMTMIAPVQGATTGGSGGTRCELREMHGGVNEADWTPFDTDFHQLTVTMTADPTSCTDRKEMIVAQIHGTSGSPPIYIAKEHHVATPRLRVFKDGPGVGNMLEGITATDTFTIRFEYEPSVGGPEGGTVNVYAAIGQVADLPVTPQFSFTGDQFTDNTGWYFKTGAYNKSEVADGGTGESITKISFLELIQPGNPDASNAAITFSANDAAITSAPDPATANLSVAAQDATVQTDTGGTTANATVAPFSAVAQDASISAAPTSGDPSASIESLDVSAEIVGSAEVASVGVAAEAPSVQVAANPGTATLGVAAQNASIPSGAPAESADLSVAALDAAIDRQQPPTAGSLSLSAPQPSVTAAAGSDGASLSAVAHDAVITIGTSVRPIVARISTVEVPSPGWSATLTPIEALMVLAALTPEAVVPDVFGSIVPFMRTGPSIVGVSSRSGPAIIAVQREIGEAGGS